MADGLAGTAGGPKGLEALKPGLVDENPILYQILGLCSALAVTNRMDTALVMCASLMFVAALSCLVVSVLRKITPHRVRLMSRMLIIATLVILTDEYLKAYHFELSKALGPYVGLIITNCLILGRCEAFAARNPILPSVLDGLGNSLGYGGVLVVLALVREPLGSGTLLGWQILPESYPSCRLMITAPGAFLALGLLVWFVRSVRPVEEES